MLSQALAADGIPKGQHYVILYFKESQEYEPPYDQFDKGGYRTVKTIEYHCTSKKEDWIKEITRLEQMTITPKYVAFEVKGLAKVEKKVSVFVTEDEQLYPKMVS